MNEYEVPQTIPSSLSGTSTGLQMSMGSGSRGVAGHEFINPTVNTERGVFLASVLPPHVLAVPVAVDTN